MAIKIVGFAVPASLESLRYIVDGKVVMAADISRDQLLLDVPEATNKLFSFKLDPTQHYQVVTIVAKENMSVETVFGVETGVSDKSPNLTRNRFTGQFDTFAVYLVPPPPTPTPPAPPVPPV